MAKQGIDKILYSIGETPARIEIKIKGESTTKFNRNSKNNSSKYDLFNWGTLMLDGSINQASHEFYDAKFKKELNGYRSNGEAKLFLDHHFENTHDKRALLNRIETHIMRRYITNQFTDILLNENKIELVAEWIREKKNELPEEKKPKPKVDTPKREKRPSTDLRHKSIKEFYEKNEKKHGITKAMNMTVKEFSCHEKTVNRARGIL
jgi:hypothetical protein